jgi:hypothetical protein
MRRRVVSKDQNQLHAPSLDLRRDLRQVPDNQEVFVYSDSSISIVVEILERVGQTDDEEAARCDGFSISMVK